MRFGKLGFEPAADNLDLVAKPVANVLKSDAMGAYVSPIDPILADTAAFCEHYGIGLDVSANCVILEAKRADRTWYVAVMVLATMRADVNGVIRRYLDARKISFAPMDKAVSLTSMEYGGITPVGLPADWPILVDEHVAKTDWVIVGSGLRSSKLLVPESLWLALPNVTILALSKQPDIVKLLLNTAGLSCSMWGN